MQSLKSVKPGESGQVALILVLLMTIVGTAAVSLAGRQIVETRVQEVNTDSSQAMLAAQAGLTKSLQSGGSAVSGNISGLSNVSYNVGTTQSGSSNATVGPMKTGEVWEINLSGGVGGAVNLYWTPSAGTSGSRGLYVQVVNPTGIVDYSIAPSGFGTGFDSSGITTNQTLSGKTFSYERQVSYTVGTSTVMRVMILGGNTDLGFQAAGSGASLPDQMNQLTSTGTVTRGNESIKQGLGYYESIKGMTPEPFDFTLYSGTTIVQ